MGAPASAAGDRLPDAPPPGGDGRSFGEGSLAGGAAHGDEGDAGSKHPIVELATDDGRRSGKDDGDGGRPKNPVAELATDHGRNVTGGGDDDSSNGSD